MRISHSLLVGLLAVSAAGHLAAQELLTPEEAVRIALEASRTVQAARNDAAIARNNATAGNAGYLPRVDLTGTYAGSNTTTRQRLQSGETIDRDFAAASTTSAGIGASWIAFEGFRSVNRMDRLELERDRGELGIPLAGELVREQVLAAYYAAVAEERALAVLDEALRVSGERLRIADARYEAGETSKRDQLQARADLNSDRSALLRQQVRVMNAHTTVNVLLNRPAATPFRVMDTITLQPAFDSLELERAAIDASLELRRLRLETEIARADRRIVDADRYPRIGLTAGYNLQLSDNPAGVVATNRSTGFVYGATLSMNLFDGWNTDRMAENADITIATTELAYADAETTLRAQVTIARADHLNRLELAALERENVTIARENLDLAVVRFGSGAIIPLELREAQTTYVEAAGRLLQAEYEAKVAEITLLRLMGRLR